MTPLTAARRAPIALTSRVGVELTPERVRAVRVGPFGGTPRTYDAPWDPSRPGDAVAALRTALGSTGAISLAVGMGFLQVKQVTLPPVPARQQARMLALEPERYFAEAGVPLAVALADDGMAFAAPADLVASWVAAFEEWGPVTRVEPAPVAAAREFTTDVVGTYRLDSRAGEAGIIDVDKGKLRSARRIPISPRSRVQSPEQGDDAERALPPFHVPAGAVRGTDEPLDGLLAPEDVSRRLAGRRRRSIGYAIGALAAALLFALWALDLWRARTLRALEEQVAALETRAAPASAALQSLLTVEAEAESLRRNAGERADPFAALAAIGAILPRDAVVLSAKATGNEWQLDGTARDAAALVPLFEKDGRFEGAHFLSASSRFREGNRTYETYSLALRYRSRP